MTTVATTFAARRSSLVVGAAVALAPLAVVLVRLGPPHGVGLALRLAVAGACVLLLPGALIVRIIGAPVEPGLAVSAALAWSLVALFFALAATFALNQSLSFTLALLATATLVSAVPALLRRPREGFGRRELFTLLGVVAVGIIAGAVVWWSAGPVAGDALEHLGRARKLAELPRLESVRVSELFRQGSPHPGYAFPLWHGALALVARLAGVDTTDVVRSLPALLTPLLFVVTYAAGKALFRSRWGGIAVLAGQLAIFGLPPRGRPGLGLLETLSGPAHSALLLLLPAVLALVFAFVESGDRALLLSLGAAAFALAVVHPSYAPFAVLPLGGFVLARFLFAPEARREALRGACAVGAVLVSAGLFLVWLIPIVVKAEQVTPGGGEKARQLAHDAIRLDFFGESFRYSPSAIAAGGALVVAGLLAVPFAVLARRSRWSAFVLGATVPILAVLLTPAIFTFLGDVGTVSQARRLAGFLPLSFAFAGATVLLGRLRIAGVTFAVGLGILLQHLYPGDLSYDLNAGGGPSWPVWFAAAGGAAALVVAAVARNRRGGLQEASRWTAFAAIAFVAPVAAFALPHMSLRGENVYKDVRLLTALRTNAKPGEVVFANEKISYRAAAYAPVYVAAAVLGHVWDRPYDRIRDVHWFFEPETSDADRRRLLSRYEANWVILDKRGPIPQEFLGSLQRFYDGERYVLYRVPASWAR